MPTPQEFYAPAREGNAFRQKGALYNLVAGHRGQDFNGWNRGTPIPTYRAGTVVANYWSAALGWVLVLQFSDGKYGGWSHLDSQSPHGVGTRLAFGDIVGPLGTTGRLTTGPHSHNTLSSTSKLPGSGAVEDPLPYIRAALGNLSTAGGVKAPVQPPTVQEDDMAYIAPILEERDGKIVPTGDGYSGPNGFYFIANKEDKALLERDIEATRKSARGEKVDAVFLNAERKIVDGYKSGTRPRS
jgi:hypothetical protein